MSDGDLSFAVTDQPPDDVAFIEDELVAYNVARARPYDRRPLHVFLRDAKGRRVLLGVLLAFVVSPVGLAAQAKPADEANLQFEFATIKPVEQGAQRGTYFAQPRLTCGDVDLWPRDTLNMPYDAPETGHLVALWPVPPGPNRTSMAA